MEDVPRQILPGNRVIVDITGIGLEVLPPNYALPALDNPFGLELAWSQPNAADYYPFTIVLALEIVAKPQLATLAQGSNTLGPADVVVSFDPETNLVVLQTNQDYGAADSLKGKLIQDGVGLRGVVWHNTAGPNSTLFLTIAHTPDEFIVPVFESPLTGFPPGFPPGFPVPFPPGSPIQIVEQSAEFQTQKNPFDIINGGFIIAGCGSVGVRGVKIQLAPAFANPTSFDTEIWGSRTICFEGCQLDGLLAIHSVGQICLLNNVIHNAVLITEAPIGMFACLCTNIPSFGVPWVIPTAFTAVGFVIENSASLGQRYHALQPVGRGPMMDLQLRSGVIRNSIPDLNSGQIAAPENFPAPFVPNSINPALATPGFGVVFRGGHGMIDHVKIFGCASNAIHCEASGGFLELKSVTGGQGGIVFGDLVDAPNGGYGLFLDDGGHVRVSDQDPVPNAILTNVRGTIADIHVGMLPDLPLWTTLYGLLNENYFDVQLAGAAGVSAQGTGSRLFVKPSNP
jgi:hypothetical protein